MPVGVPSSALQSKKSMALLGQEKILISDRVRDA